MLKQSFGEDALLFIQIKHERTKCINPHNFICNKIMSKCRNKTGLINVKVL